MYKWNVNYILTEGLHPPPKKKKYTHFVSE